MLSSASDRGMHYRTEKNVTQTHFYLRNGFFLEWIFIAQRYVHFAKKRMIKFKNGGRYLHQCIAKRNCLQKRFYFYFRSYILMIAVCVGRSWWRFEHSKQWCVAKDMIRAVSTSFSGCLCIKEITYSMKIASHGSVIGPLPGNPYSYSAISNSSLIMSLLRYLIGISKRIWSLVYTTKWPFSAIDDDDVLQLSEIVLPMVLGKEILLRLLAASVCHFLASLISFFGLIILLVLHWTKS